MNCHIYKETLNFCPQVRTAAVCPTLGYILINTMKGVNLRCIRSLLLTNVTAGASVLAPVSLIPWDPELLA